MKVVFFVSRNKDNRDVPNFKERKETFFQKSAEDTERRFKHFVEDGQPGEYSRYYVSVNNRDMEKTQKDLMCYFVQNNLSVRLAGLETLACSMAMKPENAATKYWLFDLDEMTKMQAKEFQNWVRKCDVTTVLRPTKSGYALVVFSRFDYRDVLNRAEQAGYKVELKKDAQLFVKGMTKSK